MEWRGVCNRYVGSDLSSTARADVTKVRYRGKVRLMSRVLAGQITKVSSESNDYNQIVGAQLLYGSKATWTLALVCSSFFQYLYSLPYLPCLFTYCLHAEERRHVHASSVSATLAAHFDQLRGYPIRKPI